MDQLLFDFLHRDLAHPWLDAILPVYREKTTWIPLYLVMAVLLWRSYGWRRTFYLLLVVALVVTVADQIAASVLKPLVGRLRPCAELADVRELVGCGGRFSFPSNHATNHFAVATVLSLTWLGHYAWGWRLAIFTWAATISLAQVYVGKHYPSDIVAGAALGMAVAIFGVFAYRRLAKDAAI